MIELGRCIETLVRKQLLGEALIKEICEKTKECAATTLRLGSLGHAAYLGLTFHHRILMRESNVVHISAPVTVVGDIHGSACPYIDQCERFLMS